jgi:SAM-dependent methyltransferase
MLADEFRKTFCRMLPVGSEATAISQMIDLGKLKKPEDEDWNEYLSRIQSSLHKHYLNFRYLAILRHVHPRYREQYRLETCVGVRNCWEQLKQYQFNILTGLGLKPEHSLLEIGCGPLTAGLKLIAYLNCGNYVGIDRRALPLTEGYKLIAKYSLVEQNPTLINSCTFGKNELPPRTFDYIWMSQLSYHLEDALIVELFEQARSRMTPDSVFLFDVLTPDRICTEKDNWAGFSFYPRPIEFFSGVARRFGLSITNRGQILNFGYPKDRELRTNLVLEFRLLSSGAGSAHSAEN